MTSRRRAVATGLVVGSVSLLALLLLGERADAAGVDGATLVLKPLGKASSTWSGNVTAGDFAVTDDPFDTGPARITGEAMLSGDSGEVDVSVDVARIPFVPLAFGTIRADTGSTVIRATVVSALRRDPSGAVRASGVAFSGAPFPLPVTVSLAVHDAGRTPGDHLVTVAHNGRARLAVVHVPPVGAGDAKLPLLLNLHGFLERHWMVDFFGETSAHADAAGYIVAYPQSTGLRWLDGNPEVDDTGFVSALIDRLVTEYGADPSRVYVAGLSNGGFYTHVLACDLADRLGAAVSVVGYLPEDRPCDPGRPFPMTILNGTADPLVSHLEGRAAAERWVGLNGCDPASAVVTHLPDIVASDGTTVDRWDWSGCGAPVVYYEVQRGGHLWYGHTPFLPPPALGGQTYDIDTNAVIWDFVSKFTAPGT